MEKKFILTAFSKDRPGIVADISEVIYENGCNLEDSTMTSMLDEFAIITPVPVVLQEGQIHVADNAIIDHLDAYTAPRLVEYFDADPCEEVIIGPKRAICRAS